MIPTPVPISSAEQAHVNAFKAARPDWRVAVLDKRWGDEKPGEPKGAYPRAHPYLTGMNYVLKNIVPLAHCDVLDIASPVVQSVALASVPGIKVTVLDVRQHNEAKDFGLTWKVGNATALPYKDASWSVVTSMWVMGHVGDGRYGDPFDVDGDRKMIGEIARVLKPGGTAIIGPGLVDSECGNVFNLHRLYTWKWLGDAFKAAGLSMVDHQNLPIDSDIYVDPAFTGVQTQFAFRRLPGYYGVCKLHKPKRRK